MKYTALYDVRAVSILAESNISTRIHHYIKKEVDIGNIRMNIDRTRDISLFLAMKLHYGDLNDSSSLVKIIATVKPQEIYNLGAMSHVKVVRQLMCLSFENNIVFDYYSRYHSI
jgi:GDP-D-mannose dehydratase